MATFIKAGFWEKLCKPCKGYKGWLNLDQFIQDNARPYKVYAALLTQPGLTTVVPTFTVLENTIGDIVWTRSSSGEYVGTLTGAFPAGKTFGIYTHDMYNGSAATGGVARTSDDTVQITVLTLSGSSGGEDIGPGIDSVEIRVYP